MTTRTLRAALAAFLLGTAAIGSAALVTALPAQAAGGVHAAVGNALNEAKALAASGKYKDAMARVNEAAAAAKTSDETAAVNQMKQYIAVKSGDASIGGALGAKAKFANDYAARRFRDVIADGDVLRKNGALDSQSQLVIAQAYYQMGDAPGCLHYLKQNFANGGGDDALQLQMSCAYAAHDDDTQRAALEQLVAHTGKPDYWSRLLKLSENAHGMTDETSLGLLRLKLLTGSIAPDDYNTAAELALSLRLPGDALTFLSKGVDAKAIPQNDRTAKLTNNAKQIEAQQQAARPKALAAAQGAPQGDALVEIGAQMTGEGNAKDAIGVIKSGLAKPLKNKDSAEITLGVAYYNAGQKDDAVRAFNSVKPTGANQIWVMLAHLWSLAAHH